MPPVPRLRWLLTVCQLLLERHSSLFETLARGFKVVDGDASVAEALAWVGRVAVVVDFAILLLLRRNSG